MKIKSLVLSALVAGTSLVAVPALACDGHKDDKTVKATEPGKAVTLVGMVTREGCPMEAKSMDCTGCVLTLDAGKDGATKYMIVKDAAAEKMLKGVFGAKKEGQARIEVKGELFEKDGKKLVRIKSYKLVATA
jgi:hypothetical protein